MFLIFSDPQRLLRWWTQHGQQLDWNYRLQFPWRHRRDTWQNKFEGRKAV